MTTVRQYLNNLKDFRSVILDEQIKCVQKLEPEIIKKNVENIDNHVGADGVELNNSNPLFTGIYKPFTAQQSLFSPTPQAPKIAGQPYNFVWTGDFMRGFQVDIDSSGTKITIYSTGTGSGSKAEFFKGYKNIFGLTKENQIWLNNEITRHLQEIARKYI